MAARTTFGTRQAFGRPTAEIASPRAAVSTAGPAPAAARTSWPFLTITLSAILFAVFLLELRWRTDPVGSSALSLRDCVALGGSGRYLVLHAGEWWRMFTAPLLHGNWPHLIGNTIALLFAGISLERIIGRAWLAASFVVGALAGSVGSLAYTEATASVGASGAIMCLVTVLFALGHHYKAGKKADKLRRRAFFVVISALVPNAATSAEKIDLGAHFGGFAAGIVLGFLILIMWPDEDAPMPPFRAYAVCIAAIGVAIALYAATLAAEAYPAYAARAALLIPTAEQQADPVALANRSAELVEKYPHDPMARLLRGTDLFDHQDYTDAAEAARAGLAEHEILATEFGPVMEARLNMLLAASLWGEGSRDEAKRVAAPLCTQEPADDYLAKGREIFTQAGICS